MTKPFQELLLELELNEADPEKCAPILEQLAERIDEIKSHTDDLFALAGVQSANAEQFAQAAKARKNEAERILDRVQLFMEQRGFEKLPGKLWRLDLRTNNPKVVPSQEPNAEICLELPKFVKREVSYSWDKKAIAIVLKDDKEQELQKRLASYVKLDAGKRLEFEVKK